MLSRASFLPTGRPRGDSVSGRKKTSYSMLAILSVLIYLYLVSGAESAAHGADSCIRFEYTHHAVVRGTVSTSLTKILSPFFFLNNNIEYC